MHIKESKNTSTPYTYNSSKDIWSIKEWKPAEYKYWLEIQKNYSLIQKKNAAVSRKTSVEKAPYYKRNTILENI